MTAPSAGSPSATAHGNNCEEVADPSRVWLPDIVSRIADFLAPNEVAATLRLVCKATASFKPAPVDATTGVPARRQQLRPRAANTIRLSEPVPRHAFHSRWIASGGLHRLSLRQRQRLLALTAASGDLTNLRAAAAAAACSIGSEVAVAAAAAGRLHVLRWLQRRGVGMAGWQVLAAAAGSGRREVFLWLVGRQRAAGGGEGAAVGSGAGGEEATGRGSDGELDGEELCAGAESGEGEGDDDDEGSKGSAGGRAIRAIRDRSCSRGEAHPWSYEAVAVAAARAGQADMLPWLAGLWRAQWREREQQPALIGRNRVVDVMEAVAEGCSADTFVRLYDEWVGPGREEAGGDGDGGGGGGGGGGGDGGDAGEGRRARRPVLRPWEAAQVVAAAAGSPLPCWEAKLVFLADVGYSLSAAAGGRATARPDWRRRLDWLEGAAAAAAGVPPPLPPPGAAAAAGLGFGPAAVPAVQAVAPPPLPLPPLDAELARAAACVGNAEAVRYVCVERGARLSLAQSRRAVANAVEGCHLECLEVRGGHRPCC